MGVGWNVLRREKNGRVRIGRKVKVGRERYCTGKARCVYILNREGI